MQLLGRWGSAAPTTMHDTTVKQGFHIVLKFNFRETGSAFEGNQKLSYQKLKGLIDRRAYLLYIVFLWVSGLFLPMKVIVRFVFVRD